MSRNLLAVVGLTCTGKGDLAFALADALGGPGEVEIVVCDAVKVYRGADVGSAKPSADARRGYRLHLVDVAEPGDVFSAGRYMDLGRTALASIWQRGKLPLLAGGTGLYFRALLAGVCAAPPADAGTRDTLRRRHETGDDLYAYLLSVDPTTAARLHPSDTHRIIRALEVFEITGVTLSAFQDRPAVPLQTDLDMTVVLDGAPRWLDGRIAARTAVMLEQGLIDECRRLIKAAKHPDAPPLNAIGYSHVVEFLNGAYDQNRLTELINRDTRRYAKRQRTWFKKEPYAAWWDAEQGTAALTAATLSLWRKKLSR